MAPANERGEFDQYELSRWLTDLKAYVENNVSGAITLTASQITSGVFDPARIPDLPFTRIQMTGRHLLGRTTDGLGDAEEITVTGGLTLAAGILRLTPVVPTAPIVTGMPLTVRDSDDGTDEARWAMAAVPRAVTGATGATGANGMDGADGVDGGYWPAPASGVITTVVPTYVVGSGTNGNLALWQLSGSLGDGPAASNVPLLNAANTFSAANPIILGGSANGTLRTDDTGLFHSQAGTNGFTWFNNGNSGSIMSLSNTGVLSVLNSGTHIFGGGGTTSSTAFRLNGGSGTGIGVFVQFQRNGTTSSDIGDRASITGAGTSADLLLFASTSNAIGFMTNGSTSERWGINAAGDFTFGASSHIADSNGTPSIGSGFGGFASITGNDYAFKITLSSPSAASGTVTFGHTFSNAPAAVASGDSAFNIAVGTSTTTLTLIPGGLFNSYLVLVRGY